MNHRPNENTFRRRASPWGTPPSHLRGANTFYTGQPRDCMDFSWDLFTCVKVKLLKWIIMRKVCKSQGSGNSGRVTWWREEDLTPRHPQRDTEATAEEPRFYLTLKINRSLIIKWNVRALFRLQATASKHKPHPNLALQFTHNLTHEFLHSAAEAWTLIGQKILINAPSGYGYYSNSSRTGACTKHVLMQIWTKTVWGSLINKELKSGSFSGEWSPAVSGALLHQHHHLQGGDSITDLHSHAHSHAHSHVHGVSLYFLLIIAVLYFGC